MKACLNFLIKIIAWCSLNRWYRRKIRLIESNVICRFLKKFPVKGLCGRCFTCLRPSPLLWPHTLHPPPPVTHCILVFMYNYSHGERGGGELTREKVRGAIIHKAGRKYQHDWLYLQSTPVKTTFRVCCLYSYLAHGWYLYLYRS